MLDDKETFSDVVAVLAEFFQDSFKEDAAGVGDWLARNGTTVDLFVELVDAMRIRLSQPSEKGQ